MPYPAAIHPQGAVTEVEKAFPGFAMHIRPPEIKYLEARMVEEGERAGVAEAAIGCRYAGLQVLGLVLQTERRAGETGRWLHDDDSNGQVALRGHGFRLLVASFRLQEARYTIVLQVDEEGMMSREAGVVLGCTLAAAKIRYTTSPPTPLLTRP